MALAATILVAAVPVFVTHGSVRVAQCASSQTGNQTRSLCVSSETATRSTAITVQKREEHLADEPHKGIAF